MNPFEWWNSLNLSDKIELSEKHYKISNHNALHETHIKNIHFVEQYLPSFKK